MLRTAYSQILNSSRDFSTALCDGEARLVAQAEHVPIHVGAIPWAVRVRARRPSRDGCSRATSTSSTIPYHGNNHLPDLTAFVPVFVEGEVAVLVDQPRPPERHRRLDPRRLQPGRDRDLAGGHPDHAAEALRRRRAARRRAADDRDQRPPPARLPGRPARDDRLGPRGRAAAARAGRGVRRRDGASTAVDEILDGAERQARACIAHVEGRRLPRRGDPGRRRARLHRHPRSARRSPSRATRSPSTSATPHPQVTGFVNSSFPNMMSAVHMAFAYLIDPRTPKNSGRSGRSR